MSETTATDVAVEKIEVSAYTVPLETEESDGTLRWGSTTMILVQASGGGKQGLGYTYGDVSVAKFIESKLVEQAEGTDALSPPIAWAAMQRAIRNAGRPGVGAMAVSAVDNALWDLKAHLLELPLAAILPRFHDAVPIYGSGGFTSYSIEGLQEQLGGWAEEGIPRVKMKVARHPEQDPHRIKAVRDVIGDDVELLVDANGAYSRKQALYWAERFAEDGIIYLEEPVTSEDREGLRFLRDHGPGGVAIAAGEYEWDLPQVADLADCVDILQADVTRCGGITNFLRVDGICKGRTIPFSAHCAPSISAHACCAVETLVHLEYFHDHVLVENLLFDGVLQPEEGGYLRPDPSRPGLGLELKRSEAEQYTV